MLNSSVFLLEDEEEMYTKLKEYAWEECGGDPSDNLLELLSCIKIVNDDQRDRACRVLVRLRPAILGTYLQYRDELILQNVVRSLAKCTKLEDLKRDMERAKNWEPYSEESVTIIENLFTDV